VLTGEYPPQPGGVADYTALVARGLAAAGDRVTVYAPAVSLPDADEPGVTVRRLAGGFGPRSLAVLGRALDHWPGRVLLQYAPHAFGWKGMNVPLCAWLWSRRRPLDVMFHEVAYPIELGQPWKHRLLAAVTRGMASLLLRAAGRVFVSIPGWGPLLHTLAPRSPAPIWAPIPSNLPVGFPAGEVLAARSRLAPDRRERLVGHFGTYGSLITRMLEPAVVALLTRAPDVRVVLLGRGGPDFAAAVGGKHPVLANRLTAPGHLEAAAAAAHVAACDVLVQPYPDGISSRRTSAMAALALGRPVVTTDGHLTEPLWRATRAVAVAPPDQLASATLGLLADPDGRAELGRRAADLYREQFAVEHTVRQLRTPLLTSQATSLT
jgi:glycosyltransferase involved in cell wall biosynthesis